MSSSVLPEQIFDVTSLHPLYDFPKWLSQSTSLMITSTNIDEVARNIISTLPEYLRVQAMTSSSPATQLRQAVDFLKMFQGGPEVWQFFEAIKRFTPHQSIFEALPALQLMVLITESRVYPYQVGHDVLFQIFGNNISIVKEIVDTIFVSNLTLIPQSTLQSLYRLSQDVSLMKNLNDWIEGQRLLAFLSAIPQLGQVIDEIPNTYNPRDLEGFKNAIAFLRERLKREPQVNAVEELTLNGNDNYPQVVVEGIPREIQLFQHLKKLKIISEDIHTLPAHLSLCKELEEIVFMCGSRRSYVPEELGNLPKLKIFIYKWGVSCPGSIWRLTASRDIKVLAVMSSQ